MQKGTNGLAFFLLLRIGRCHIFYLGQKFRVLRTFLFEEQIFLGLSFRQFVLFRSKVGRNFIRLAPVWFSLPFLAD